MKSKNKNLFFLSTKNADKVTKFIQKRATAFELLSKHGLQYDYCFFHNADGQVELRWSSDESRQLFELQTQEGEIATEAERKVQQTFRDQMANTRAKNRNRAEKHIKDTRTKIKNAVASRKNFVSKFTEIYSKSLIFSACLRSLGEKKEKMLVKSFRRLKKKKKKEREKNKKEKREEKVSNLKYLTIHV